MDKQQWNEFRNNLLTLHKALLDFEKKQYEGKHGQIKTPQVFLGLVMESPSFAWLRRISELIVGIDELLESKEEMPEAKFTDMLAYCKTFLRPNENGTQFEKNYYAALHKDPSVALIHGKVQAKLK